MDLEVCNLFSASLRKIYFMVYFRLCVFLTKCGTKQ